MSVPAVLTLRVACVLSVMLLPVGMVAFAQEAAPAQTDPAPGAATPADPLPDDSANVRSSRETVRDNGAREALCLLVEAAARANDLPLEFFARVIWQESRFQPQAVGPVTRSGRRAQGIAQFMPGTASERGLLDPFDPVQALPKAAEFLSELRDQFGNLGLAAAASMPVRSAYRIGSPDRARCRRRHAITSFRLPEPVSRTGPAPTRMARFPTADQIPVATS
jgi:soluble lytic murein transglycosylase-like protein